MSHRAVQENHDDVLVRRTLAGEEEAFTQLVTAHRTRILRITSRFFRHYETAEDMTQETFTKAYFALSSYQQGAIFRSWLAKIAVNQCISELRRRQLRTEVLMTDVTDNEVEWFDKTWSERPSDHLVRACEAEQTAKVVNKLLARLVPESRLILYLLHAEERSIREIAQVLGWTEARVKTRAFRARNDLRRATGYLSVSQ